MSENKSQLKNFADTVLADAKREKEEIELEIKEIRKKELSQVESKALEEAYALIHDGIAEVLAGINKDVSLKTLEARKEVLLARDELKRKVFDKALINIKEFKKSRDYEAYLFKSFDQAIKAVGSEQITVALNPEDQGYQASLAGRTSAAIQFQYDNALLGGVVANSTITGRYADLSINARVSEELERYDSRIQLNLD